MENKMGLPRWMMADDINYTLMTIERELDEEDIRDIQFLCKDYISSGKPMNLWNIFTSFQEQKLDFLPELLFRIKHYKLLSHLGKNKHLMLQFLKQPENCKISNYRVLLYDISKEIDDKELDDIKFLTSVPKGKCKSITSFLDLCTVWEKEGKISPNNLQILLNALEVIKRKDLTNKVERYQEETTAALSLQESGKQQDLKQWTQEQSQEIRYHPEVDAKPGCSAGTNKHHESQMEDPSAVNANFQVAETSPVQETSNLMETLNINTEVLSKEPSKAFSLNVTAFPSPRPSEQTTSKSTARQQKPIEVYKMDSSPLGICLILNNKLFPGTHFKERSGTDKDAERLKEVFNDLGFDVRKYDNLTVNEMVQKLEAYSHYDHNAMDCFVCCILSHGEKDVIVGKDGKHLQIGKIRTLFSGSQCTSLLKKPKLFFIQACQGTKQQKPCFIRNTNSDLEFDSSPLLIPEHRDFLFAMSTVPGYVSCRTKEGSWFIQTLCTCLEDYCKENYDILDILTEVNKRVSEMNQSIQQMPEQRVTLSKRVAIVPPSLRKQFF
ncbi:caspase-7-like isoform X3 [Narcine bancroftii]|uniref:caspase-7-like isoform X3 n=1 Tax=Narcine bancroftii TaxID=1343680 RepID=UPI00383197EA